MRCPALNAAADVARPRGRVTGQAWTSLIGAPLKAWPLIGEEGMSMLMFRRDK